MLKRIRTSFICFVLGLAIVLGGFLSLPIKNFTYAASSETENTKVVSNNMGLSDDSFNHAGSGINKPSNFSGAALGSASTKGLVGGIISLKASDLGKVLDEPEDPYKFNSYFDRSLINSIMSPADSNNDFKNVLMISSSAPTAYAYKSHDLEVLPGSYYVISVYVYTPDLDNKDIYGTHNAGAYIGISGDITATSSGINTKNTWQKYTIYLAGSNYKTLKVKLSLQLGHYDEKENKYYQSAGFVFFDLVQVISISNKQFENFVADPVPNSIVAQNPVKDVTPADFNGGFESGFDKWTVKRGSVSAEDQVFTPFGASSLKMSAQNMPQTIGVRSQVPFKIEGFKFYHVGIYVNKKELSSGEITANLVEVDSNGKDKKITTLASFENSLWENSELGDWTFGSFYIAGSIYADHELYLELWMGNSTTPAYGTVYWDHITIEEISYNDYTNLDDSNTQVTFDDSSSSTNLSNGNFTQISNYDEFKFPMPVSSWNQLTLENANKDLIISGIVKTNFEHFEQNKADYDYPAYPYNKYNGEILSPTMLMVAHTDKTASGYKNYFTVSANSYAVLGIKLNTQIKDDTYGAELILKDSSGNVIAKHRNINTNGAWESYEFFIEGTNTDISLSIEIWLGAENNFAKGHLFVELADVETENITKEYYDAYDYYNGVKCSFKPIENFANVQDKTAYIKTPVSWSTINPLTNLNTVVAGVVNLNEYYDNYVGLAREKIGKVYDQANPNVLIIGSKEPTAFGYRWDLPMNFEENTYSKVTVRLKTVDIPQGVGAMIKLDDEHFFTDINTQYRKSNIDNDYVEYSFFINTGANTGTCFLEIWLGRNDKATTRTSGYVIVDCVKVESIDEGIYAENVALLDPEDKDADIPDNIMKVAFSETEETKEEKEKFEFPWWGLPTILFSILLVFTLTMVLITYIAPKRKKVKSVKGITYDRSNVINKINAKKKEYVEIIEEPIVEEPVQESAEEQTTEPQKTYVKVKKYVEKKFEDTFED